MFFISGPEGGEDVPRYEGFARDVFNAIHDDYFVHERQPVCTPLVYDVITSAMGTLTE